MPLVREVVIVLGLAVGVAFVCSRIRIPIVVGLILTGVLAGPHGLGLVKASGEVDTLAQIGVIALLFSVGMEFSLKNALRVKTLVFLGGSLQIGLTLGAASLILWLWGLAWNKAFLVAFMLANSSTVIMAKAFQERAELESPHARTSLGISVFQDIATVQLMLFLPLLAGEQTGRAEPFLVVGKGLVVIAVVMVAAHWLVPMALRALAVSRERELFLLGVICLGLAVAQFAAWLGLSMALGAFLAGLIISETDYNRHALSFVIPFRDVFTSIFFVSVGMLLDVHTSLAESGVIIGLAAGTILLKTLVATLVILMVGYPFRTAFLVGLALSQVGECSFVVAWAGLEKGLMDEHSFQLFLAVSVLTMLVSPFLIAAGPYLAGVSARLLPGWISAGWRREVPSKEGQALTDHLIIVGLGPNGRYLARAASGSGIQHVIIELNAETVKREKSNGRPIFYGDATQEPVLAQAGVQEARVMVIAISDPPAVRRIVELARRMNPNLHIIARTRFLSESPVLLALGANEVISEDFESSVEIFTRVMARYMIPRDTIEAFVSETRREGYDMLRSAPRIPTALWDLPLPELDVATFRVEKGSDASGRSLEELALRKAWGVTLVAARRDGQPLVSTPGADFRLEEGDLVVLIGAPQNVAKAARLFRAEREA